jgi:hypothetical protein
VPNVEDAWPSWEDAAVDPEVLGNYLRDFDKLLRKFQYRWTTFGHFGDGCVHCRITFDLKTAEGVRTYRSFMQQAAALVVRDGQARAELLPKMYGSELVEAFREFKSIWDPQWKMNPGKVVDPYPLDSNLWVGPDYRPAQSKPTSAFRTITAVSLTPRNVALEWASAARSRAKPCAPASAPRARRCTAHAAARTCSLK